MATRVHTPTRLLVPTLAVLAASAPLAAQQLTVPVIGNAEVSDAVRAERQLDLLFITPWLPGRRAGRAGAG